MNYEQELNDDSRCFIGIPSLAETERRRPQKFISYDTEIFRLTLSYLYARGFTVHLSRNAMAACTEIRLVKDEKEATLEISDIERMEDKWSYITLPLRAHTKFEELHGGQS